MNLNGYLTDDAYSLSSPRNSGNSVSLKYKIDREFLNKNDELESDLESENEDADETFTMDNIHKQTKPKLNMSDYLDRL